MLRAMTAGASAMATTITPAAADTTSSAGSSKTTSFMSVDSTEASVSTKYHFSWKKW